MPAAPGNASGKQRESLARDAFFRNWRAKKGKVIYQTFLLALDAGGES
jgi:hypothetical protein